MKEKEEYWKFAEIEDRFNSIQAGIRKRASTWLLAAYGAIAVLLKISEDTWLIPPAVLIGIVSIMATLGLLVLWFNDQPVYQRLLNSGFLIGLKQEFDNPKLPLLRAMMMYSAEGKGMSRWMAFYYTIPMGSFLIISIAVTILNNYIDVESMAMNQYLSLGILVIICIVQVIVFLFVQSYKLKVGMKDGAILLSIKGFEAMFTSTKDENMTKFGEMIGRYMKVDISEDKSLSQSQFIATTIGFSV